MPVLNDFYEVKSLTVAETSKVIFTALLNKDHSIYNGHFPDFKVTPGVAMLQIIKNTLEEHLKCKLLLQEAKQVKFLNLVEPEKNSILDFEVSLSSEDHKLHTKSLVSFPNHTVVLKCNATFVRN